MSSKLEAQYKRFNEVLLNVVQSHFTDNYSGWSKYYSGSYCSMYALREPIDFKVFQLSYRIAYIFTISSYVDKSQVEKDVLQLIQKEVIMGGPNRKFFVPVKHDYYQAVLVSEA